jgi:hypothetical protein
VLVPFEDTMLGEVLIVVDERYLQHFEHPDHLWNKERDTLC